MSQFYVGQKVVCVKNHSQGLVKAGRTYTIDAQRVCRCCGIRQVDVGVRRNGLFECICGATDRPHPTCWIAAAMFRPLDSLTEQIERIEQEGAPVEQEGAPVEQELEPQYA